MDTDPHPAVTGPRLTLTEQKLAVLFCVLLSFPLLYLFRRLDANTLTSWRWILARDQIPPMVGLLAASCLGAWFAGSRQLTRFSPHPISVAVFGMLAVLPFFSLPELLVDSGRYFQQASDFTRLGLPAFLQDWGVGVRAWTDLPLSAIFYGALFSLFGETRIVAQIANLLLFGLAILLTEAIGRRLLDREGGKTAAFLLIGMPLLLLFVPQMLNDLHVMVGLLAVFYCLLRLRIGGGLIWSGAASLAMILFSLAKYSAWPMLAAMLVSFFLQHWPNSQARRRFTGAVLTAGCIVASFLFIKRDLFTEQYTLLTTFQRQGLSHWQEGIIGTFLFQINPLVSLLALYGVWRAYASKDRRFLLLGWWIVIAMALGMARSRYLLPFLPLVALAAAYGMQTMEPGLRRTVITVAVLWGLALAYNAHLPFLKLTSMSNLMAAGNYLNALERQEQPVGVLVLPQKNSPGATIGVLILPQNNSPGATAAALPLLDLYTETRLVLIAPADTTPSASPADRYETSLQFTRQTPLTRYQPLPGDTPPRYLVVLGPAILPPEDPVFASLPLQFTELQRFAMVAGPFRYRIMAAVYIANPISL